MFYALLIVGFIVGALLLVELLLPIGGFLSVVFFVGLFVAGLRWALK